MKKYDIAVIGGYPPPIGGVSVHVERLIKKLDSKPIDYILYNTSVNGIKTDYNIFNINNLKLWLIKYFFCCNDKIIHCQDRNWYLVSILCLIKVVHKSKLLLTLHSFRENPEEFNIFKKLCFSYSIKNVDHFISVGKNEKNKLVKNGCDKNKISIIPAYLKPQYKETDDRLISDYVWEFMKKNDFNIAANAYKVLFYNNEDLYGIDMCIEVCRRLKKQYVDKKIGFVFCLPDIGDYEYYNKLKQEISKLEIDDKFLFVNDLIPLYPIIRKCNLFLRPTNTDGDSISIREALSYKVPVIASDAVERPEGTIIFKSRNIDDLYTKTVDVIKNYNLYKEQIQDIIIEDNAEKIMDIYMFNS